MRLDLPSGPAHLTYCANVHRGETWPETFDALRLHLPTVKRQVSPTAPMGVGLRLSALAAEALGQPAALAALRGFLATEDLYVFTVNGFPYGPFHGQPVKEQVYAPDWRQPERLAYTDRLAALLAALLPDGETGSVSTVPGAFRAAPRRARRADRDRRGAAAPRRAAGAAGGRDRPPHRARAGA